MSLNDVTAEAVPVVDQALSQWKKQDTVWMLSLYGTAIGAGALFLPINAGLHGIWPLVIMALLAFPITFYPHRALCRFVLSSSCSKKNITDVVEEHFGSFMGKILTGLYFFAVYPFLLMYSVALTNTAESFLSHQIGAPVPPRGVLALILIFSLMQIVRFGQGMIIKFMSFLVYPFAATLLLLSVYLIPHWNSSIFSQSSLLNDGHGFFMTLWLIIPVMVFSFNHSPIISSFAMSQKQHYGQEADQMSSRILKYSHLMMVISVMFFVFSCIFSLSPQDLLQAKQQNISILSYLANHFHAPFITYVAPCIAFIAISKSFLGHYLGAKESLGGIIEKSLSPSGRVLEKKTLQYLVDFFIAIPCWYAATLNPNILKMIETLGGPIIALLLFIMPMYAIATVPAMKQYGRRISNLFVTLMGLVTLSALFYGFFG